MLVNVQSQRLLGSHPIAKARLRIAFKQEMFCVQRANFHRRVAADELLLHGIQAFEILTAQFGQVHQGFGCRGRLRCKLMFHSVLTAVKSEGSDGHTAIILLQVDQARGKALGLLDPFHPHQHRCIQRSWGQKI
ncbi:hypothetical protein D9M71_750840 [compost metagenome]